MVASWTATEWATLLTPLGVIVTAILGGRKLGHVHKLVNSRMTEALRRIANLELALKIPAGAAIPAVPPAEARVVELEEELAAETLAREVAQKEVPPDGR